MRDFSAIKKVVIKAGTSILTSANGKFSAAKLNRLSAEVLALVKEKKQVSLVSSGAIGYGMDVAGFKKRPQAMAELQACAAIGQGKLIHAYEKFFAKRGLHTAQLLLTRDGLEQRSRFLKARQTLETLLGLKILPIINENDTVATEEIKFGDNDVLSVQVAHLIHADLVILLSDVDGFYLRDGSRLREVNEETEIDTVLSKHLRQRTTQKTVGGMKAKLEAARIAMRLGIPLVIVNGHEKGIVAQVLKGDDVGTVFYPARHKKTARKKWIAFSAARKGSLVVDAGAFKALQDGKKSLLASGITQVRGQFMSKDVVEVENDKGQVFGRGVVRYTARELSKIAGKKSSEIQSILGFKKQDEVIHRNDLVIWG